MSSISFKNKQLTEKSNIAMICILGMMAGFLLSRVALSASMFLFGINALRDVNPRHWFRNKLWLVGALWVLVYVITYFWSSDKGNWAERWQTKLPVLLMPLAMAYTSRFTARQLQLFTVAVAIMLVGSACYSVGFLIYDPAHYLRGYRQSDLLPTLPKHDHIRASLAMALFVVWCVYAWPFLQKSHKWLVGVAAALLVVYLHILATKSGLISLYLFLAGWSLYTLLVKRKLWGLLIILAIPLFYVLALRFMPTFRERKDYIWYTYFVMKNADAKGQYGDLARLLSYKVAYGLIREHPLAGVGTGDMKNEMDSCYTKSYPDVPEQGRLLPHNQFMVVALGCGIPATLLFAVWVFMPLARLRRNRQSFFFFMVWLILFLQLMIEPVLEVQFGVFVYVFFLLLQMHELPEPNSEL